MEDKSSDSGARRVYLDEEMEEEEIRLDGGGDPGSETETDDEVGRYVFQPHDEDRAHPESNKRRRLGDVVAEGPGALPSPTPSSGSDGIITDGSDVGAVAATSVVRKEVFLCRVCRMEFGSRQAVSGHMRIHVVRDHRLRRDMDKNPPVNWASTDKCGGNGRGAVTTAVITPMDEVDNSLTIVVAEPLLTVAQSIVVHIARTDLSSGQGSSSAGPIPNVSTAACQQAITLLSQIAQGQAGPTYRCKMEGCNKEYGTYQGLGGHVTGHIHREKQATLFVHGGDADASGQGGAKPEGTHPCKVCKREFKSGVALGGHMRKHYQGKVIILKKKKQEEHDIALNLSLALSTIEVAPATLAPAITSATFPSVENDTSLNLTLAPPTAQVTPATLAPAIAAATLTSAVEHGISLDLSPEPPTSQIAPAAPAPAIVAAALPSKELEMEVAEDGAEAAPAPAPAPSVYTRILRIFGCNIVVSVPQDAEEEDAKPNANGSSSNVVLVSFR
ncbi:hypothetical protein GUJ93_ZPchr0007g3138 [Zizania palustris]|uniref:C2H2-type domain-containing protein n=1 Tax=Zizania palustris TaxID=103762 RepID=A0A8J5T1X5_ZIZPA|nr:hypothetical protein GUJ93_ZPchr0007g3138 [Zizania palustris]